MSGDKQIGPRFEAGKNYVLGGDMLNRIWDAITTNRLLKGAGYALETIAGTGTRLKLTAGTGEDLRQWALRLTTIDDVLTAQIRSGTLTGLGMSGYLDGMDPDEWNDLPGTEKQAWLKLTFSIGGAPYTYSTSPETTATVWLPSHVTEAAAELYYTNLGVDAPAATHPTIDPETGDPADEGVYYFRIGAVNGATGAVLNDYIGPLSVGWCPPDSPYLVQLT